MIETLRITTIHPDGYGIAQLPNGRMAHVWGALPDELVEAIPTRRKRGVTMFVVARVLEPSPFRTEPNETHYLSCSPWQIMTIEHEQTLKERLVRELYIAQGIDLPEFSVHMQEPYNGYRNKMEFSFVQDAQDALSLAFFERAGRRKTPLGSCALAPTDMMRIAEKIKNTLAALGHTAHQLKSLILRTNLKGETLAGLFLTSHLELNLHCTDIDEKLRGLSIIYSDPLSPASRVTAVLYHDGDHSLTETVLGKTFRFGLSSFFQVNVPLFERAVTTIAASLPPSGPVVDLYSGVGTIGLSIPHGPVTLVESEPTAIPFAKENALMNNKTDAVIHEASAEKILDTITAAATIIVDPPRVGLHPKVVNRLQEVRPGQIVYLSCNPATQARDLANLCSTGYQLKEFYGYNFFPRTPHAETLAILTSSA